MFTPIKSEIAEMVKKRGEIKLFVHSGWEFVAAHEVFTTIPHKIMYVENYRCDSSKYYKVFDCKLTLNRHSFILEEIAIAQRTFTLPGLLPTSDPLPKASEHMFLEMAVKMAEYMAILSKKDRIVITSNLPTFSEIVSELGFNIRKPKFSNCFKAMKSFTQYRKEANQT